MRTRVRDLIEELQRQNPDALVQFKATERVYREGLGKWDPLPVSHMEYERIQQMGGVVTIQVVP